MFKFYCFFCDHFRVSCKLVGWLLEPLLLGLWTLIYFFFKEQLIFLTQNFLWERGLFDKRSFWEGFISSAFKNQANMLTTSSKCKFWQERKKSYTNISKFIELRKTQPNNTDKIPWIHEAKITVRDMDVLVVTWEYIPSFLILWGN